MTLHLHIDIDKDAYYRRVCAPYSKQASIMQGFAGQDGNCHFIIEELSSHNHAVWASSLWD